MTLGICIINGGMIMDTCNLHDSTPKGENSFLLENGINPKYWDTITPYHNGTSSWAYLLIRRLFQPKISIFFLFLDKNICYGYSLEVLLMSTHNICFRREIRKLFIWYPLLSRPMMSVLKFEQAHFNTCWSVYQLMDWVANSVDPDQTLHSATSDLGLQCLFRHVHPNT